MLHINILVFIVLFVLAISNVYARSRNIYVLPPATPRAGRIIGGESIDIEDAPYQVAMLSSNTLRCGGSIVSSTWIVSAGHCTLDIAASYLSFRIGSSNYQSGGEIIYVKRFIRHQNFTASKNDYDIAVLELKRDMVYGSPIMLPSIDQIVVEGTMALTSGWGATKEGGNIVSDLRQVKIPIVNQKQCNTLYGYSITDRMICAGVKEGGKDACQGDSGGPLVVGDILVGITSWGHGCARPGFPGVWARLSVLVTWAKENMGMLN